MTEMKLPSLGDDEEECTITLEQYRRFAATWPVTPVRRKRKFCAQCGERRVKGRSRFCSRSCREAYARDCHEFGCKECGA